MKIISYIFYLLAITVSCFGQPIIEEIVPFSYPIEANKPPAQNLQDVINQNSFSPADLCDPTALPLRIYFSNYTINTSGIRIEDGGWTQQEKDVYIGFLCKMFPILVNLYSEPFASYNLTIIKDLRYSGSNVFVPTEHAIHTSNSSWHPQLLTHEIVHAFRGDWTLTKFNNSSQYSPKLSGFEEGFAQCVSYEAMNSYIDTYGLDQYVSQNAIWSSDTEWNYDFKNDSSMVCENFWSEAGGTLKYYERYEQSAAAIQQLNVIIPNFYSRFNQEYYSRIRNNSGYMPTRDGIISIINHINGSSITNWIEEQNILKCKVVYGKKIWTTTEPTSYANPNIRIHFVETFPNGFEWYYYIPGQGYLYNRLNYNSGALSVNKSWINQGNTSISANVVEIKDWSWWGTYQACGVNCSKGFGGDQLLFYTNTIQSAIVVSNPITIPQPLEAGLYKIKFDFDNPNFQSNPQYGIYYDSIISNTKESMYQILGLSSSAWSSNKIFGGVNNLHKNGNGVVYITHSLYPETVVSATVSKGLFYTPGSPLWFTTVRNNLITITKPGVLKFTFVDFYGNVFVKNKYIGYGYSEGKHQFIFNIEEAPLVTNIP